MLLGRRRRGDDADRVIVVAEVAVERFSNSSALTPFKLHEVVVLLLLLLVVVVVVPGSPLTHSGQEGNMIFHSPVLR